MTDIQKAAELLQTKRCHLHYHDNGSWMLVDADKWFEIQQSDDDIKDEDILLEGGETEGYLPDIVAAMAIALNRAGIIVTVDSI